jgi:hypothetical protein
MTDSIAFVLDPNTPTRKPATALASALLDLAGAAITLASKLHRLNIHAIDTATPYPIEGERMRLDPHDTDQFDDYAICPQCTAAIPTIPYGSPYTTEDNPAVAATPCADCRAATRARFPDNKNPRKLQ